MKRKLIGPYAIGTIGDGDDGFASVLPGGGILNTAIKRIVKIGMPSFDILRGC